MLKTNSKKARQNAKNYILNHYDFTNYGLPNSGEFIDVAKKIYKIFIDEIGKYRRGPEAEAFDEWASGLPSALNTVDYYYRNSAVDVLGEILEESAKERSRYTEEQAEKMLTYLIYREIKRGV